MTYPPDRTMLSLVAFAHGRETTVVNDSTVYVLIPSGAWEVLPEEIDELTGRGWLACDLDRVEVTERGRYWAARWERQLNRGMV